MIVDVEQGSAEWLELRKTKITATDAPVIFHHSPFKTPDKLLWQKIGILPAEPLNEAMKRGQDLEPIAREIYEDQVGCKMTPTVHVGSNSMLESCNWAMCSTDGISEDYKKIIEIKSGIKSWEMASQGFIPAYYRTQIQHILWLTRIPTCDYVAFDGDKKIIVIPVERDDELIECLIEEEYKFYEKMKKYIAI